MDQSPGYPTHSRVESLILAHSCEQPEKVAVRSPAVCLTYAQLAAKSRAFAEQLQQAGVRPRDFVGVCIQRQPDKIPLLLAILRLGAAYVPLDERFPRERIAAIAEDARLRLIVASADNLPLTTALETTGDLPSPQVLPFESLATTSQGGPLEPFPQDGCTLDDIHYVRFTSGSTGRPKGVVQPQRGAIRLAWSTVGFDILPTDTLLRVANLAFDLSVIDIWCTLIRGGTVAMADEPINNMAALGRAIERLDVSCVIIATAFFHQCIEVGGSQFERLRWLQVAGDVLSRDHARRFLERFPQVKLVNGYGPTENGVYVSAAGFVGVDSLGPGAVTIGAPVLDTFVRVLDSEGRELGVGQEGELYCGGGGLSWGYANRPDLTAEKYIQRANDQGVMERLYRTGDLVRWRADGQIDFHGRMDRQVKIRGFRIELAEVESALRKHPDVRDAYVLAETTASGYKRLIGYAAVGDSGCGGSELCQFLTQSLPEYSIPSWLATVPAFPLNHNGKVDLKALPKPTEAGGASPTDSSGSAASLDPLEQQLAACWKHALHLTEINPNATFVELGGDSLVAITLLGLIERDLGRQLAPADILQHDTVRRMAAFLRSGDAPSAGILKVREGGERPLFFFPGLHGDLFTIRALAKRMRRPTPIYGLQPPGADGRGEPLPTMEAIRDFYLEQVRKVLPNGPYRLIGHSVGGTLAFEAARSLLEAGEEVELLIMVDAPRLNQPPLQRRLRTIYQHLFAPIRPKLRRALEDKPHPLIRRLVDVTENALDHYRAKPLDIRAQLIVPTEVPNERRLIDDFRGVFSWRGYVAADSPLTQLPGDHNTLWKEPHVAQLAELVDAQLAACDAMATV